MRARVLPFPLPARLATVLLITASAHAEELGGRIDVGVRAVEVSGDEAKYRQQVNLDDGPRLFGLDVTFEPGPGTRGTPDRIAVSATGLGGDPYSSITAQVREYGAYRFDYEHRESDYFYEDLLIDPADVSITAANGGDYRTFDITRVQDRADVEIRVLERATVSLGFDRYQRKGQTTLPIDLSREEFELDAPVDETFRTYEVGFRYDWEAVSVSFDQRWRKLDSDAHAFLPGPSEGTNPAAPTRLDRYVLDQPYGYDARESQLGVQARLTDRWDVSADVLHGSLDMDFDALEDVEGVDFAGAPLIGTTTGGGSADRETTWLLLGTGYDVTGRIRLTASVKDLALDQDADMVLGPATGFGDWTLDTTGYTLGAQAVVLDRWTVSGGFCGETRKTRYTAAQAPFATGGDETTDRRGYYVVVGYRPAARWNVTLSAEDSSIDDPFTLASPTDYTRYRLRGAYRWDAGLTLSGSWSWRENENDASSWRSETRQADVRLTYRHASLTASIGASFVDIDRRMDQIVTGGTRQDLFLIRYDADADSVDAALGWQANDRLELRAAFRDYDNAGSFAVERRDAMLGTRISLARGFDLDLSYRYVDFDENDLEHFDADLWQASLIYGW